MKCSKCRKEATSLVATKMSDDYNGEQVLVYEARCNEHNKFTVTKLVRNYSEYKKGEEYEEN